MTQTQNEVVSIFMVVRNGMPWIQRAVESLLAQTYQPIEIIVQDGASNDGTLDYLKSLGDKINLLSHPDKGPDEAFHIAIRRCQGDIIGCCLADEAFFPDSVEKAVAYLRQNPLAGAVVGSCQHVDINHDFLYRVTPKDFDILLLLRDHYLPQTSASFYRRKALLSSGLNDGKWIPYGFEVEFWFRMVCDWPIGIINDDLSKYACHEKQLSKSIHQHTASQTQGHLSLLERAFSREGLFGLNDVILTYAQYHYLRKGHKALTQFYNHDNYDTVEIADDLDRQSNQLVEKIKTHHHEKIVSQDLSLDLPIGQKVRLYAEKFMGNFFRNRGQISKAILCYRYGIEVGDIGSGIKACHLALRDPVMTEQDNRHLCERFINQLGKPIQIKVKKIKENNPITIGYLCKSKNKLDFIDKIYSLERYHDDKKFKIILYIPSFEDVTHYGKADKLTIVGHLSALEFANIVQNDSIDIFVTLADLEQNPQFSSLNSRLAPLQVNFSSHVGVTYFKEIDWILSDQGSTLPALEKSPSENLWKMTDAPFCFDHAKDSDFMIEEGEISFDSIIFGSLSEPDLINNEMIFHWSNILKAVPQSKLFIRHSGLNSYINVQFIENQFLFHNIEKERLILRPWASLPQIIDDYQMIHISLDSWPYSDSNMIARSLYLGVPAISYKGLTLASQTGGSILYHAKCPELIAENWHDYEKIAISLAKDPERLMKYRKNLRHRLIEKGLTDGLAFTKHIEQVYEKMISQLS
jgi:glycosyltransferase involved in cell wall biosynthesis